LKEVENRSLSHSARDGDGCKQVHQAEKLSMERLAVREGIREQAGLKAGSRKGNKENAPQ
jgi:hypothetical protein